MSEAVPTNLGEPHLPCVIRVRFPGKEDQAPKELHYFALRGLGELPRQMLEVSETNYDMVAYFFNGDHKKQHPFMQLPVLKAPELGGEVLAQSSAICRHIAREAGMDGATAADRAKQDQMWELAKDLSDKKSELHKEGEMDEKVVRLLTASQTILKSTAGLFYCGDKPGIGDIGMFNTLHTFEEIRPGFLNNYPEHKAFVGAVSNLPSMKAYLSSIRRLPITNNELGKGHTGITGYSYITPLNPLVVAEKYEAK